MIAVDRADDVEQVPGHADVDTGFPAGGDLVLDVLVEARDVEDRTRREVPFERGVELVGLVRLQVGVAAIDLREFTPGHAFGRVGRSKRLDRWARHRARGAEAQAQVVDQVDAQVRRGQEIGVVAILRHFRRVVVDCGIVERPIGDDVQDLRIPGLRRGLGIDHANADVAAPARAREVCLHVGGQSVFRDAIALQRVPHRSCGREIVSAATGTCGAVIGLKRVDIARHVERQERAGEVGVDAAHEVGQRQAAGNDVPVQVAHIDGVVARIVVRTAGERVIDQFARLFAAGVGDTEQDGIERPHQRRPVAGEG